jgi:beta-carotene ketolase (CrtW type)
MAVWTVTLIVGLGVGLHLDTPVGGIEAIAWMLVRTLSYSGLFITAHDAMHGTVAPNSRLLNDAIGRVCLLLYAGLDFATLRTHHRAHHATPARPQDPDFSADPRYGRWLQSFVTRYLDGRIVAVQALLVITLWLLGVTCVEIIVLQVAPALFSLLQLFTFGTYLPHRPPPGGEAWRDEHRATSTKQSAIASFVTCFHFGMHWEHHVAPWVPWWLLPQARVALSSATTRRPASNRPC